VTTCNQAYRATHHAERQRGDTPKNRDCNTNRVAEQRVRPEPGPGTRVALERTFAGAQAKRVRRTRRQQPGDP